MNGYTLAELQRAKRAYLALKWRKRAHWVFVGIAIGVLASYLLSVLMRLPS